jgi:alcohol dehydrogenase class IV
MRDINIPVSSLPALVNDALQQKRLLSRCPMKLEKSAIEEIYQSAYESEGKFTQSPI